MSAGYLRPVSTIVLGFALVAPTVWAQEATVRVRGTIERAEGDTYFVKSRDGAELRLKLAPKASVVALTQARGLSIVHETVYEQRLGYTAALNSMGANIQVYRDCLGGTPCRFGRRNFKHSAVIAGPSCGPNPRQRTNRSKGSTAAWRYSRACATGSGCRS